VTGYLMLFFVVALTTALILTLARLLASRDAHHTVAPPPRSTALDADSDRAGRPAP
jgi:hypothetical protein